MALGLGAHQESSCQGSGPLSPNPVAEHRAELATHRAMVLVLGAFKDWYRQNGGKLAPHAWIQCFGKLQPQGVNAPHLFQPGVCHSTDPQEPTNTWIQLPAIVQAFEHFIRKEWDLQDPLCHHTVWSVFSATLLGSSWSQSHNRKHLLRVGVWSSPSHSMLACSGWIYRRNTLVSIRIQAFRHRDFSGL